MSIRDRLLAPCATHDTGNNIVKVDVPSFLRNLLLFNHYVVQSMELREVPVLVDAIGYEAFIDLLESGTVAFDAFRLFAGHLERDPPGEPAGQMNYSLVFDKTTRPTRHGFYEITNVTVGEQEAEVASYLSVVDSLPNLSEKKRRRLKMLLDASIVRVPADYGTVSTAQTHFDLDRSIAGLREAVARKLTNLVGRPVSWNELDLTLKREGEIAVAITSNLGSDFSIGPDQSHRLIGNALLALDRLNARVEKMRACSAVSGTQNEDWPFLEDKLSMLYREAMPETQFEQFSRVLELAGLADLGAPPNDTQVSFDRFLDVRSSRECIEFREWLRSASDATDGELRDRISSIRSKLGFAANTRIGKSARLVTTTGVGFIPIVGPIAGIGAGALDSFLIDKLFKEDGPIAFLTQLYPSIFD